MSKPPAMRTRLAHVTDAHTTLDGRPTTVLKHRSLEILHDALDQIRARSPDCVLFGGDNIDNRVDGQRDLEAFAALTRPLRQWRCVPGNHEASNAKPGRLTKAQFQRRFAGEGVPPDAPGFSCTVGNVRVIGLDTTLVGAPGGFVAPDGLVFLAGALKAATEPHIVVLGHHLLVSAWAPHRFETWDQDYLIQNRSEVISLLASDARVRAYLCGHHHAHRITRVDGVDPGHGFYQVLTASPVAFPHSARVLTFDDEGLHVETIRPRDPTIVEEGRQAVLLGRKARRFEALGLAPAFLPYLEGEPTDNDVWLHHQRDERTPSAGRSGRVANR